MRDIAWPKEDFPGTALFSSTTCLLPTRPKSRSSSEFGGPVNLSERTETTAQAQVTACDAAGHEPPTVLKRRGAESRRTRCRS